MQAAAAKETKIAILTAPALSAFRFRVALIAVLTRGQDRIHYDPFIVTSVRAESSQIDTTGEGHETASPSSIISAL